MTEESKQTFETRAIHAGQKPDRATGAVMPPIHVSSTFAQDSPGVHQGFEYARTGNPTRSVLEENLAALENGKFGRGFASGMAAIDAVIRLFDPGDRILVNRDVYGGTHRLFTGVYEDYGYEFEFLDLSDPSTYSETIPTDTELIWIETPTNPLLKIIDINRLCKAAASVDAIVAVDNTFATPYLQRPLDLGATIVVHSLTKYLGGHSDVVGGAVITNNENIDESIGYYQNSVGATPDPFACYLVLRGIKTLPVRMDRHCQNASAIASSLDECDAVKTVYYPGLPQHRGYGVAKNQMDGFGGMVSVELDATIEQTESFVSATEVFTLAESLGGVESLIEQPATMTHAAVPPEERQHAGISDALIRLSVGLEGISDLKADLHAALTRADLI